MKQIALAAIGTLSMGLFPAHADTIKIGVVGPFSGPFALQGKNFKAGIDADLALNGPLVRDIEVADELLDDRRAALDDGKSVV